MKLFFLFLFLRENTEDSLDTAPRLDESDVLGVVGKAREGRGDGGGRRLVIDVRLQKKRGIEERIEERKEERKEEKKGVSAMRVFEGTLNVNLNVE